jgi:prepilin-type N-terminal cleavage/methylation domain-containing protein
MKRRTSSNLTSGFTLVETIVTLVLVAILGVFMIYFSRTTFLDASQTVSFYEKEGDIQTMMEEITAQYRELMADDSLGVTSLSSLKTWAQNHYGTYVVGGRTGYVTFSGSGDTYDASGVSPTPGADPILLITLQDGDQTTAALFTE